MAFVIKLVCWILFLYSSFKGSIGCQETVGGNLRQKSSIADGNGLRLAMVSRPLRHRAYVKAWTWLPSLAEPLTAVVWRPSKCNSGEYEVVALTPLPSATPNQPHIHYLSKVDWIAGEEGDVIGFDSANPVLYFDVDSTSFVEYASDVTDELTVKSLHLLNEHGASRVYPLLAITEENYRTKMGVDTSFYKSYTMKRSDSVLMGRAIECFGTRSAVICMSQCMKHQKCISIKFNKPDKICCLIEDYGNSDDVNLPNFNHTDEGDLYYELSNSLISHVIYRECKATEQYELWYQLDDNHNCTMPEEHKYCDEHVFENWTLCFKGMGNHTSSLYDAWVSGDAALDRPEARLFDSADIFRLHDFVNNWQVMDVDKVKLTLYNKLGEAAVELEFIGSGSDVQTWFEKDRLESSPWQDLNDYSNNGIDFRLCCYENLKYRTFLINKQYYFGCAEDVGWMVVTFNGVCPSWEGSYQVILYSASTTSEKWASGNVKEAWMMTIHVKRSDD